jgi:hypothetical protein
MFTAQGQLVLDPTNYSTGGTVIGRSVLGQITNVSAEPEVFSEASTGGTPRYARYVAVGATVVVRFNDFNTETMALFARKMNTGMGWSSSKIGQILEDADLFNILVRPDHSSKPHLWIPRAMVVSVDDFVFERSLPFTSQATVILVGLGAEELEFEPFAFGVPAALPAMPAPPPSA